MDDILIAADLARELMDISRVAPFKFGVRFDAKAGPCKVPIHNVEKAGTMGTVTFRHRDPAIEWVRNALLAGYSVCRAEGHHWPHEESIARRRRDIEYKEARAGLTRAEIDAMDDEIPF